MDLNDVWQSHRRFILGVGGGLVALLLGHAIIVSTWGADEHERAILGKNTKLSKLAAPKRGDVAALEEQTAANAEAIAAAVTRMRFQPNPRYVLGKDVKSPDLYYNQIRSEASEALVREAARQNIRIDPSLGLPEFTPAGRESIQRHLLGLNVVEQVVVAAILAEVRSIDSIEIEAEAPARRRDRGRFVEPLAVKFRATGTSTALGDLLSRVARSSETYLAIADAELVADPKRADGLATLQLTVQALTIADGDDAQGTRP